MGEGIDRTEYNESMRRVHEKIETVSKDVHERVDGTYKVVAAIQIDVAGIKAAAEKMETYGSNIYDVVYGKDAKGGLVTRVGNLATKVNMQWFLIATLITGLFSVAIWQLFFKQPPPVGP